MTPAVSTLTIRFSTAGSATYRVDLEGPDVGERRGPFAPPYTAATWQAIMQALEPGFVLSQADKTIQAALKPLGDIAVLPRTGRRGAGERPAGRRGGAPGLRRGAGPGRGDAASAAGGDALRRGVRCAGRAAVGVAPLPGSLPPGRHLHRAQPLPRRRDPADAGAGRAAAARAAGPLGAGGRVADLPRARPRGTAARPAHAGRGRRGGRGPAAAADLQHPGGGGDQRRLPHAGLLRPRRLRPRVGRPAAVRGRVRRPGADQGERAGRRAAQHRCAPGAVGRVPVGHYRRPVRFGKPDRSQHLERHCPRAGAGRRAAGHRHAGLDARRRRAGIHPPVCPVAGGRQAGDRGGGRRAQADHPRRVRRDVVRARALRPAGGRLSGCSTRRAACPRTPPTCAPR